MKGEMKNNFPQLKKNDEMQQKVLKKNYSRGGEIWLKPVYIVWLVCLYVIGWASESG